MGAQGGLCSVTGLSHGPEALCDCVHVTGRAQDWEESVKSRVNSIHTTAQHNIARCRGVCLLYPTATVHTQATVR